MGSEINVAYGYGKNKKKKYVFCNQSSATNLLMWTL